MGTLSILKMTWLFSPADAVRLFCKYKLVINVVTHYLGNMMTVFSSTEEAGVNNKMLKLETLASMNEISGLTAI